MLNLKKLFKKYAKQTLKPAYVYDGHVDTSHTDVDAQTGHIDNGQ